MRLEVRLDDDRVPAGGTLRGHVLVLEGGPSRALRLTVTLRERSPAFEAAHELASHVLHEGDLATGQALDFTCGIGETAAPAIKGKHGEVWWELRVVSDERGLDTVATHRFDVLPASQGAAP